MGMFFLTLCSTFVSTHHSSFYCSSAGLYEWEVVFYGPNDTAVVANVTDNGNGTTLIAYRIYVAGYYNASITLIRHDAHGMSQAIVVIIYFFY